MVTEDVFSSPWLHRHAAGSAADLEMFAAGVCTPDALFAWQQLSVHRIDSPVSRDKIVASTMLLIPNQCVSPRCSRRNSLYGHRGERIGEASHPGPLSLARVPTVSDYMRCIQTEQYRLHIDTLDIVGLPAFRRDPSAYPARGIPGQTVRTCGDGRCGLHAVFGSARTTRNDLYLDNAESFLYATWDMSLDRLDAQLAEQHRYLITRVISKLWVDFVRPHWFHPEIAPPEERIFLDALRAHCSQEFCRSIDSCLQQQLERQRSIDHYRYQAQMHSKTVFTIALESVHWRAVALARGLIPDTCRDYCNLSREVLDTFVGQLPDEDHGRWDWLLPCTEVVGGRVQIVGTNVPYQGRLDDLPSCKYAALFDDRDCFDGLRISLLGQICGPDWHNLTHLLSFDVDDARFNILLAFCTEYVSPLQEASHPVPEPADFLDEAWRVLRIAVCHPTRHFYLSYDEILLVCALRGKNVLILHRREDEREATLLGEVIVDTSRPVTMVSTGIAIVMNIYIYIWFYLKQFKTIRILRVYKDGDGI